MSRSRVARPYPESITAIPPTTTKSTPASVRRLSISRGAKPGHAGGRRSWGSMTARRGAARVAGEVVERLEVPQAPIGGDREVRRDRRLVDPGPGDQARLDGVSGGGQCPLERLQRRV